MEIYIVKSGDTIIRIAGSFGVSPQRIISDNGLNPALGLVPGQALVILKPLITYTVGFGDTVDSVARKYGITASELLRNNPALATGGTLMPGTVITVQFTQSPARTARINGYAYPFISRALLNTVLPFLSTLTIFGYGFTDSGELVAPDDTALIAAAVKYGAAPIFLLSSITENGNFSTERASRLFNSPDLQNRVLNSAATVMRQKGYRGLDIDFEYVEPSDSQAFLGFVQRAAYIMHSNNFFVNVDLAPKTSVNQRGLLYEAHDYGALGAVADTVLLMTYEWGYTYGPPLAIAPIGPVTEVTDFALTQIFANKIMLGIPNYGYDWALPFQKGITRAVTVGNAQAITIAQNNNANIQYDESSQAPFFYYRQGSTDHVVWFEDARSIKRKFDLVTEKNLLGIGYWNLMRPFPQNLALLSTTFTPQRV